MKPILFWALGVLSLATTVLAVVHPRPIRCAQGLVGLTAANSLIVLLLGAPLLGCEMLLVTLGGGLVAWAVLRRREILRLGVAGLARFSVSRLLALLVAVVLGAVLWPILLRRPGLERWQVPFSGSLTGFGAWLAVFLILTAVATAWLVVRTRRREDQKRDSE